VSSHPNPWLLGYGIVDTTISSAAIHPSPQPGRPRRYSTGTSLRHQRRCDPCRQHRATATGRQPPKPHVVFLRSTRDLCHLFTPHPCVFRFTSPPNSNIFIGWQPPDLCQVWVGAQQPPPRTNVHHRGVELRANLKPISHRCHLFEVAFVWELTKENPFAPGLPPGRQCFYEMADRTVILATGHCGISQVEPPGVLGLMPPTSRPSPPFPSPRSYNGITIISQNVSIR